MEGIEEMNKLVFYRNEKRNKLIFENLNGSVKRVLFNYEGMDGFVFLKGTLTSVYNSFKMTELSVGHTFTLKKVYFFTF